MRLSIWNMATGQHALIALGGDPDQGDLFLPTPPPEWAEVWAALFTIELHFVGELDPEIGYITGTTAYLITS